MFFLAVLVWNRVSISTILVWNRVWFVHSSLELGIKLPPYFVYMDYECTKKEQEHVSILICAMWEDHISSLTPLHFYGPDCTEAFYDWLLTRTRYWTTRSIWLSSSVSWKAAMVCLSIGCTGSDLRWSQDFEFEVRLSEFHSFHPVLPLWW